QLSTGSAAFALESSKTISIPIAGDDEPEPDETFTVRFTSNTTGALLDHSSVTVTILNDDIGFGPRTQNIPQGSKGELSLNLGGTPVAPLTATLTTSNGEVIDIPSSIVLTTASTTLSFEAKKMGWTSINITLPPPFSQTFTAQVNVYEPANLVIKPAAVVVPEGGTATLTASFDPALTSSATVQLKANNP